MFVQIAKCICPHFKVNFSNILDVIVQIPRCICKGLVLTKRPVASEHVGKIGDDIEGGVDDIGHGQVDDEVVRHRAHSGVGHHDPYNWREITMTTM